VFETEIDLTGVFKSINWQTADYVFLKEKSTVLLKIVLKTYQEIHLYRATIILRYPVCVWVPASPYQGRCGSRSTLLPGGRAGEPCAPEPACQRAQGKQGCLKTYVFLCLFIIAIFSNTGLSSAFMEKHLKVMGQKGHLLQTMLCLMYSCTDLIVTKKKKYLNKMVMICPSN